MRDFFTALGLVLVLEGLSYAAFPKGMRETLERLKLLPDSTLRRCGLAAAFGGLIIVYLAKV